MYSKIAQPRLICIGKSKRRKNMLYGVKALAKLAIVVAIVSAFGYAGDMDYEEQVRHDNALIHAVDAVE